MEMLLVDVDGASRGKLFHRNQLPEVENPVHIVT